MKKGALPALAAASVAAALAAGYWWGSAGSRHTDVAGAVGSAASAAQKPARKLLYYRNPMGLPDTSAVPKKDPMGMDYVPVYDGEDAQGNAGELKINVDKVQKLGVRTEPAAMRVLDRVVRASGRIEVDERRMFTIAPKFEGWVERLHVNATGQAVARGQPLFEVYSPELVSAQREYAIAVEAARALKGAGGEAQAGMDRLAESSLARLRNWDIPQDELKALAQSGAAHRTLTFRSPVSGIVMEKKAVQGMRFMPGDPLFQIADLSSVWVLADVFEQDLDRVRLGEPATIRIGAYPDRTFQGRVAFVYPTLKPETRTASVRIEMDNANRLLKPAMFAQVEMSSAGKRQVLAVPTSAVIDSGVRQVVLVQKGEGRFEPRDVKLGARSDDYVEIMQGVKEGEPVVVSANFLIDAESNLKAAIGGFGAPAPPGPALAGGGADTPKAAGHRATGKVESLDAAANTVSIEHGPVATLKWPAMTMEFKLANESLRNGLEPGRRVTFEFVERAPGEWVITKLEAGPGTAPPAGAHQGH
jgi:RND family efflux transporter MFP subunit